MTSPKISIVTACFNRVDLIADAVESALAQEFPGYEHLIVDGGSTDGTLELLSKYPHLQIVSEKDNGIYDAINKGIQRAQGDIIGILNSDDIYQPGIFAEVERVFQSHPEIDVVSGQATQFVETPQGRLILESFSAVTPKNIEYRLMFGVPIINAWFFRRKVFDRVGMFDLNFPIAADRDFQIRCWLNRISIYPIERFFYHYRSHRQSLTGSGDLVKQEGYLRDMLRLARQYIHAELQNQRAARRFVQWRDSLIIDLLVSNLRRKNFKISLQLVVSTVQQNPAWVFVLLVQFPLRLIGFLYRGLSAILFPQKVRFLDQR